MQTIEEMTKRIESIEKAVEQSCDETSLPAFISVECEVLHTALADMRNELVMFASVIESAVDFLENDIGEEVDETDYYLARLKAVEIALATYAAKPNRDGERE
jgi:tRNA U34 5-carboxymethylaminomethyl modifying GTPase MnmE/TrmE